MASDSNRILNGQLTAHGVDLERLVHRAIRSATNDDHSLRLSREDYDDLFQELVIVAWQLAERADELRGGSRAFSTGCYRLIKLRIVDWRRARGGRTRWRFSSPEVHSDLERAPRPSVLSLDAFLADDGEDPEPAGDRLDALVAGRATDPAGDRSPDLARALVRRDGPAAHAAQDSSLRERPTGRPRRGTARPDRLDREAA